MSELAMMSNHNHSSEGEVRKAVALPTARYPTGWFQVAWSDDLSDRGVRLVRYFGEDIVLWRGESGSVFALEAYCQHVGANLGVGGTVCGEDIECPFHGWQWSGDGTNALIPYSAQNRKQNLLMRSWPVREWEGCVLLWNDVLGREPLWEPPDLQQIVGINWDDFYPITDDLRITERLKVHPQLIPENTADLYHVITLHGSERIPTLNKIDFVGPAYYGEAFMTLGKEGATSWLTPNGPMNAILRFGGSGIGQGWVSWSDEFMGLVLVGNITPVDEEYSDFRVWITVKRDFDDPSEVPTGLRKAIIDLQWKNLQQDFSVWNNMRPLTVPNLVPEETATYGALRKWAWQFYPELPKSEQAVPITGSQGR